MHQRFETIRSRPEWRITMIINNILKLGVGSCQLIADGAVIGLTKLLYHIIVPKILNFLGFEFLFPNFTT